MPIYGLPTAIIPRDRPGAVMKYLHATINFDRPGLGIGVPIGALPAGALMFPIRLQTNVAWTGTTPLLTIGTNDPSFDDIAAAADIAETTLGAVMLPVTNKLFTIPTIIVVKYTATGAVTQGQTTIVIPYAD